VTTRAPKKAIGKPRQSKKTSDAYHEEEKVAVTVDATLMKKLWPFVRPHARLLVVSLVLLFVLAAAQLVRPLLMGRVVAHAGAGDAGSLLRDGVLLALFVVGAQVLSFLQTYVMQVAGARAMADLRAEVFAFFQRLSLRYFDKTPVGRLVTRATSTTSTPSASCSRPESSTPWATSSASWASSS
jgi:ATP-binding cassette subfamily B multidrug efflux pump